MDKIVCKYCNSSNIVKYGFVEGVQRYFCNDCRRKFSANDHLYRMKTPASQVSSALDSYYKGLSINDIRDNLNQQYQNCPSSKTVYGWITKFTDEAINQFKDYHPKVGDTWIADETVLKLDGKNIWCIDIIDEDTRFLLATKLSPNRETKDIESLMKLASEKAGKAPKRVLTDGWRGYLDGIELAYGADSKHIITDPFGGDNNNTELIERWHSTLKERTKVLRGLKSIETANRFLAGFLVYYNYLRPHEWLNGSTPAERAGVSYTCKTWGDIIRLAEPQVEVLVTPAKVDILSERKPLVRPIARRTYNKAKKHEQRKLHRLATARRGRRTAQTSLTQMRGAGV
ncbi:MAG: IS1/IS6 family transposase [Chloroflexi bacterium]|nr:IS1/IS6 family transposase [Chloroflexota bacterium]